MQKVYNKNSKLDFGMYKGYDLGIVYVFDPPYIEWCIQNIDLFYIEDMEDIKNLKVINTEIELEVKITGDPALIPFIDAFETFQDLIENVELTEEFIFSDESLLKNEEKRYLKNRMVGRRKSHSFEVREYDDNDIELMNEAGGYSRNDDYELHSWEEMDGGNYEACPACGAIGEYNCCNYSIENNCG